MLARFFLLMICAMFVWACTTIHDLPDASTNYNPSISFFTPRYKLYASNDSTARLYFQLDIHRLASIYVDTNSVFPLQLSATQFDASSAIPLDSFVRRIDLRIDSNYTNFTHYVQLPLHFHQNTYLQIKNNIPQLNIDDSRVLLLDSSYLQHSIFYCLLQNNQLWFETFLNNNKEYSIRSEKFKANLKLTFCDSIFPSAAPPFNLSSNEELKTYNWKCIDSSLSTPYIFVSKRGLFQLCDADSIPHCSFFCADSVFPAVHSPQDMLNPLVYIEKNVALQRTPKLTLDAFWFKAAGANAERARELIRVFYNRVQLANRFFSSYKEGWKTDRGMIFILLGLPSSINISSNGENWVYEGSESKSQLTFAFQRNYAFANSNDYVLQRSQEFATVWQQAQDSWKSGKVFIY